ncbi:major facilitator superfamily domain-containing protein [Leptodontidium sp. 2 PMI_412]|nr:major facilitator superfamily domain-containing protein [Leptodontidium sp. 2 PMI_412]
MGLSAPESRQLTFISDEANFKPKQVSPTFPEGGLKAWLVVLDCWCASFASFGYTNSFGVYETYYLQTFLQSRSPSDVASIGSIQAFARFSTTLIGGPVCDRYGPMYSVQRLVGIMATTKISEHGHMTIYKIQIVGHYFSKERAMAMSFASTGSPTGGIIYLVFMTNRICGFISLFLLIKASVTIRPTLMIRKETFLLLEAFKKPVYSLEVAAPFLVILGLWMPYFYIASYGLEHGMDPGLASYLFALLNAGSFVGRVLEGTFAQYLGQFNVIKYACYASAILRFCWLKITSSAGLIVFSLLFGATSGIVIALMMSTIAHTADHSSKIGTYIGMATFVVGFAGLAGTPIAGH